MGRDYPICSSFLLDTLSSSPTSFPRLAGRHISSSFLGAPIPHSLQREGVCCTCSPTQPNHTQPAQHTLNMAFAAKTAVKTASGNVPLRLIALPLCKKPELIYYYAQKRKEAKGKATASEAQDNSTEHAAPPAAAPSAESTDMATRATNLITKATNLATNQWEKFGKADKGNWKYKVYMRGEKLMDRIEYEEWLLKALDASTAPKLWSRKKVLVATEAGDEAALTSKDGQHVPLYYPPSLISDSQLLKNLGGLLEHREPHHNSAMKKALWIAPLTFPFAVIPVVPNFPLFYVLWRAWSHWRALKSSQYLKGLLSHDQLQPESSKVLDELYASKGKDAKLTEASPGTPEILLTTEMVDSLKQKFDLDDQAEVDIRRAISQAEARMKGPHKE